MTIQELIDALTKIEDKSLTVFVYANHEDNELQEIQNVEFEEVNGEETDNIVIW